MVAAENIRSNRNTQRHEQGVKQFRNTLAVPLQGVVCEHNNLGTLIFLAAVCG